jgi:PPP family 3-phenylpropionic acid transporter
MQLLKSRTAIELALVQVAMNLFSGLFLPFFPVWFASRGFDPAAIGYALAAAMILRSMSSPVAGIIADARDDRRSVIFAMSAIAIICWSIAGPSEWLPLVFVFAVLGNVAYSTSGPQMFSRATRSNGMASAFLCRG